MMRGLAFFLSGVALLATCCVAMAAEPFVEGINYYRVASPAQLAPSSDGRVEVVEVFNYGCVHCFDFQPVLDAWSKTPEARKARLAYLPAGFNPLFAVFARGYLIAQELGVAEQTHHGVYDQVWKQHFTVQTIDGLADLYAKLGVNKGDFMKESNSFAIDAKSRQALQFLQRYGIDGTPTIVVAGKYRITGDSAGSPEKIFAVVNYLVDRELAHSASPKT